MTQWSKIGLFTTLLFVFSSTGCRTVLSQHIQAKAEGSHLITAIRDDPAPHKGKTLILGGEVVGLVYQGRRTEVEFAELPLENGLHPALGIKPGKSYYVLFPERLDRLLYSKGKIATVAASLIGTKEKEGTSYPLFAYDEVHVWNKLRETRFPDYGAMIRQ